MDETSDSKESIELLLEFSHIIEAFFRSSHLEKEFLFLIGKWLLKLSKTFKDLFLPSIEILKHALSLGNKSNFENIVHHRIEKKLARNAPKYEMMNKDNEPLVVLIEKTYSPGIEIHKVKEKVFQILSKNINFLKKCSIGHQSSFNKDTIIQTLSEWFKRNDSSGVIERLKKEKNKKKEAEAWKEQLLEAYLKVKNAIRINRNIKRIKNTDIEILETVEKTSFFENCEIGLCKYTKNGCDQFLRFFKVEIERADHLTHIIKNLNYMELYHPFLINYYGMEVEIKNAVVNQDEIEKQKTSKNAQTPKPQKSAPGNLGGGGSTKSASKQRKSLFQTHDKDYLELTVYTDYFEQFLFTK